MRNKKEIRERGITLVALVITIIILLILAGISIQTLSQTNLFDKTKQAKNAMENAENKQNETLTSYEEEIDNYLPEENSKPTDISALKYYIDGENLTITGFEDGKDVKKLVIAPKYTIDGKEYTVTKIEEMAFIDNITLKSVYVPETVTEFGDVQHWKPFLRCWNLEKVTINENNPNYKSIDGVVYSKDMKRLVFYPGGRKNNSYSIPDGVEITEYSSLYIEKYSDVTINLKELNIPNSIKDLYIRGWRENTNLIIKWNNTEYSYEKSEELETDLRNAGITCRYI